MTGVRILLCCATERGLRCLDHLSSLTPDARLVVASFREQPHEPPFLDAIRAAAHERGAGFVETRKLDDPELAGFWRDHPFDLLLTVNWRYLVPPAFYRRARLGAWVFHDSLLPAYRGFSPTVWAILNGERETGVSLIEMAEEVDSGDLVDQRRLPIEPDETIATVTERVTRLYLDLLEDNLPALLEGRVETRPQDASRATYCCPRRPEDNEIRWHRTSREIHDLVRAVTRPYPGAFTWLGGRRLSVWGSRLLPNPPRFVGRVPGRVVSWTPTEGSVVLTGDGALLLTRVQLEGAEEVEAASLLHRPSCTLGTDRGRTGGA